MSKRESETAPPRLEGAVLHKEHCGRFYAFDGDGQMYVMHTRGGRWAKVGVPTGGTDWLAAECRRLAGQLAEAQSTIRAASCLAGGLRALVDEKRYALMFAGPVDQLCEVLGVESTAATAGSTADAPAFPVRSECPGECDHSQRIGGESDWYCPDCGRRGGAGAGTGEQQ